MIKYTINHNAFATPSPEVFYWVGFLMADGCVYKQHNRNPIIQLEVHTKDIEHLEKFKAFLQCNNPIKSRIVKRKGKRCFQSRIRVSSKQIAEDLAKYGVVPNKTHVAKVTLLEHDNNFWRGVIDGDGCLTWTVNANGKRYPRLSVIGSRTLIEQFFTWASILRPDIKSRPHKKAKMFGFQTSGQYAKHLISELYCHATVSLDRKQVMINDLLR